LDLEAFGDVVEIAPEPHLDLLHTPCGSRLRLKGIEGLG
jgi:hypothetical protein